MSAYEDSYEQGEKNLNLHLAKMIEHMEWESTLPDADWTDEKNDRRCELIDKEIEGTIRPFEKRELAVLQQQMLAYRRKNAPLPLKEAQALHQELLKKAGELVVTKLIL